ncbi:hypothetical protein HYS82_03900 [Candidatus Amesbacteria bacterium]|nr:hypothetical protein [Candidatus Amesbacteria bacterium]
MNRFQVTSLANMSFDLAKVWFGGVVAGRLGLFRVSGVETLAALSGGLLCVMVGLYMGKEVKDK